MHENSSFKLSWTIDYIKPPGSGYPGQLITSNLQLEVILDDRLQGTLASIYHGK